MTVLLDTHVLHWWSSEPDRLSDAATEAVDGAHELAVSGVTWFELAWLVRRERILLTVPLSSWLAGLAAEVRTVAVTWPVAHTAATLPTTFPSDPADRIIYATAVEHGWPLVTKDGRLRDHQGPVDPTVW